ncbi:phospholipid/cholesterol/gamma-HCH transport system substrate-binding protein [Marmoricola sp. OAE513]|uniref:MCE family protein n=1 Tax=Marmoricola sp. OAE513 TaxID=2817894 RepID=UPI001AE7FAD8
MTAGVRNRLIAFAILSAVGIVYVTAGYLGLIDKVTGRGLTLHADLPASGGIFVGSDVSYRGVNVGKVNRMTVIPTGVRLTFTVEEGTRIPRSAPLFVHNLSAVGEQYLDFEPSSGKGPYAGEGHTFVGTAASLPVATDDVLLKVDGLVSSVDRADLQTLVTELGTSFRGTGDPLRRMVDAGSSLVDQARANEAETIGLLESGRTVLATQRAHAAGIRSLVTNLADLTGTLQDSDVELRTILQGGTVAVNEVNALMAGLAPTLPVFLTNLVTVNQVVTARLNALEQTLVTLPVVVSGGFTGTPGDGYGHINLQFDYGTPACTAGYLPPAQWRPATDLTDTAPYTDAHCASGPPVNQRGSKYAPAPSSVTGNRNRVSPYDASTGQVSENLSIGRHTVFGDNSWQWMLLGEAP